MKEIKKGENMENNKKNNDEDIKTIKETLKSFSLFFIKK